MTTRTATFLISGVATVALSLAASACGDDAGNLSPQAERGRSLSNANGCASCHGSDGRGGVGPGWRGLSGSEVELADGSTVVADDDYLVRAILDPMAEVRAGFAVNMPEYVLSEQEALDIVAYIKEVGAD